MAQVVSSFPLILLQLLPLLTHVPEPTSAGRGGERGRGRGRGGRGGRGGPRADDRHSRTGIA